MMRYFPSRFDAAIGLVVAALAVHPLHAQIIPGQGLAKPQQKNSTGTPPPPALPGARTDKAMVAPPERVMSDLPPNDALFDSINRGDITSARDAISRGADLDAKNVLGMTPLELSVDLGRNDISFLLLSYRDGRDTGSRPVTQTADAKPKKPARPTKSAKAEPTVLPVATGQPTTPAAPRAPRLFAGDGGAPVPAAGFLGFGGSSGASR